MFDISFSSHIDNLISKCPVKFERFFATFRNSKTLYKRYDTRVHLCRYTHSLQSFFRNGLWYRKIWEFPFLFVFNVCLNSHSHCWEWRRDMGFRRFCNFTRPWTLPIAIKYQYRHISYSILYDGYDPLTLALPYWKFQYTPI